MIVEDVQFLLEVLKRYSPSKREKVLTEFLSDQMRGKYGFKNVRIDGVGNVYGEVGSGRPLLLLAGHMDTVPGEIPISCDSEYVYGRGAADAKSALTGMLLACARLADADFGGKILFAGLVDEEGESLGVKELLRGGINADYAVFGEPSGTGNITIGYRGSIPTKIVCRTRGGHGSSPWLSESSIEKAFEVWRAIKNYVDSETVEGDRFGSMSTSLTNIKGGDAYNVIADRCEFYVDIRVPTRLSTDVVVAEIDSIVNRFRSEGLSVEREFLDRTEPFECNKGSLIVRSLVRGILEVQRKRPTFIKKTGTGDMNIFGRVTNIPTVTYGPGDARLSHTDQEKILISEFLMGVDIYERAARNLFTLAHAK